MSVGKDVCYRSSVNIGIGKLLFTKVFSLVWNVVVLINRSKYPVVCCTDQIIDDWSIVSVLAHGLHLRSLVKTQYNKSIISAYSRCNNLPFTPKDFGKPFFICGLAFFHKDKLYLCPGNRFSSGKTCH